MSIRCLFAALLLATSSIVSAQNADQEIVSITESADPVVPGANFTYTIVVRNNGPDAATNGGVNFTWDGSLVLVSTSAPPGFTCFIGFGGTCNTPSFAAGATATITLTMKVDESRLNYPDGAVNLNASTSGTTIDPNGGNNARTATTNWDSPQVDPSLVVTDSPDPVFPGGDITYTATLTQAGPDTATNANFNVYHANGLKFRSVAAPAGWACTPPPLNGTPIFNCKRTSWPPGQSVFTVVLRADPDTLGINDGTLIVGFDTNAIGNDTNTGNNVVQVTTAYVTPDADVAISVVDSPDPVTPDGTITYTATLVNNGPDAAPGASFSVYNAQGLQFQSISLPAGFNCSPAPTLNGPLTFGCSIASFANGANATITVVARAPRDSFGVNDGTIQTAFQFNSQVTDPVNANNSELESTAYVAPDADLGVNATDAPDPVVVGNTITYTATVTNAGPDAATGANFSVYNNGSLRFQSVTPTAPFTCTPPPVGSAPIFGCTAPSLASGASATFTVVVRTDEALVGVNGGTVQTVVTTGSVQVADPNGANNAQTLTTTVLPDRLLSDGFE